MLDNRPLSDVCFANIFSQCDSSSCSLDSVFYRPEAFYFISFSFSFLRFFFLMWTIFKVFIEFVTILLLFHVWVFWL